MLTKSRKCRWEEGILLASLLPIDANCSLTMLEICEESLISLFLLFGFLIVVKVLSFFLRRNNTSLIPVHVFLALVASAARLIICNAFFARGGGGVLPYIGYIGMCGAKGYGFLAVLV